jgi:K+ transporter
MRWSCGTHRRITRLRLPPIDRLIREPGVLAAINPVHGFTFFVENRWRVFVVLGSVFRTPSDFSDAHV